MIPRRSVWLPPGQDQKEVREHFAGSAPIFKHIGALHRAASALGHVCSLSNDHENDAACIKYLTVSGASFISNYICEKENSIIILQDLLGA